MEPILVVDSDQNIADTLDRVLRTAGFRVKAFYDHNAALLFIETNSPAVALVEAVAPEHFGLVRELCQKSAATPTILMAGREVSDFPKRAMRAGAAGFLLKPFSNAELIASVKSHLSTI